MLSTKVAGQNANFQIFEWSGENGLTQFCKPLVRFFSNFASIFSEEPIKVQISEFWLLMWKFTNLHFDRRLLLKAYWKFILKVYKVYSFSQNSTEELCLMTLKSDAKFKEKLICRFKDDMWNLVTFDLSTQNSKFELWWDTYVQSV